MVNAALRCWRRAGAAELCSDFAHTMAASRGTLGPFFCAPINEI
jgi:hypothetical protein